MACCLETPALVNQRVWRKSCRVGIDEGRGQNVEFSQHSALFCLSDISNLVPAKQEVGILYDRLSRVNGLRIYAVHDTLLKLMSAITPISILLNLTQRVKSGNFGKRLETGHWLTRRAMRVLRIG